jgi:hypothetical protein
MLFAANGLIGRPVAASDGRIGAVRDFLLDDWRKVRWMVVDTGQWLPGRKVLIHPSAIVPIHLPPRPTIPMLSFGEPLEVSVNLTTRQIEASPDAGTDQPVTDELERRLFDHYRWDPLWSAPDSGAEAAGASSPPTAAGMEADQAAEGGLRLGSAGAMKGFAVYGTDGEVGSIDNVFIDDIRWSVRYLVVATRGWLHAKLVQVPLHVVKDIDWPAQVATLRVTRERVSSAPAWDPVEMVDEIAEERMRGHFGPPGRGI